jgi:MinD-like ATPase involved in chromosome partitioning or flagellar assembly
VLEPFALIVLFGSFIGMAIIFWRKLPVLVTLEKPIQSSEKSLFSKVKNRFSNFHPVQNFSYDLFLQKILSKIRVLALKIEHKTTNHLQNIREKARKKKESEGDNYWQAFKKITKRKK